MRKLFKYMSTYSKQILLIIAVLTVQALCNLAIPSYTSDIVNIGIQQGGIDEKIPEIVPEREMEYLLIFLSDEERDQVLDVYTLNQIDKEGTYVGSLYRLKNTATDEEIHKVQKLLSGPMILTEAVKSGAIQFPKMDKIQIYSQLEKLGEAARVGYMRQWTSEVDKLPESIQEQGANLYIRILYKEMGRDMGQIQKNYLILVGGKMFLLALIAMVSSIFVGYIAARVAAGIGRDLRGQLFHKVVNFSNTEFDHFSTASLITRSSNDIQQIQQLIVMLLTMVLYAPIMAVGGVVKVFRTNVDMAWIIGLAVVLLLTVVITIFTFTMPRFKILQKLVDKLNLVTREILTGLPVIRAFSTEKHEEKRFDKANMDLKKTNLFVNRIMTFMMPFMMLIMNAITVLIVWEGANGIDAGNMQVGDIMAFIQYTMQIIMAFLVICMISIMLPRAAVAADRVDEVLQTESEIKECEKPLPFKRGGDLVFDHVSFRYPNAEEYVLHDINFTVRPGETTAIIGSTGSGKSTLIDLIPRFYDVTEGKITLGGVDIRSIRQKKLREALGYVPQKGILFSGTIASNILFGRPNASKDDMEEAVQP